VRSLERIRGREIELRQQDAVGGANLGPRLLATLERVDTGDRIHGADHARHLDALMERLRPIAQPEKDRLRFRDASRLEHDVIRLRPLDDVEDAVPEVVFRVDLAANAAAGELEHVASAADDEPAVDRDAPELVDEHGDAPARRRREHAVERGRFAGTEEPGEDRERYALHRDYLRPELIPRTVLESRTW